MRTRRKTKIIRVDLSLANIIERIGKAENRTIGPQAEVLVREALAQRQHIKEFATEHLAEKKD